MINSKKTNVIETELEHMSKLLDDSEDIYSNIKDRFISYGGKTSKYLKKFTDDENQLVRIRANEIISIIKFEETLKKFKRLSEQEDTEILEDASLLIASVAYPAVDMSIYRSKLDQMASDIEMQLLKKSNNIDSLEPVEVLNTMNNYLFYDRGFKGNEESYYEPDNSFLNKVIDNGVGIPVSLSILYILIARRLNIPVFGISLPGHFILKYSDSRAEFFIDPYNKGVMISVNEAKAFVKNIGMSKIDFKSIPYLKNTTDKEIVLRVLRNLSEIYKEKNEKLKKEQVEKLMETMA